MSLLPYIRQLSFNIDFADYKNYFYILMRFASIVTKELFIIKE